MPFSCTLNEGRIKLSPTGSRSYPIVGGREAAAVTVCNPQSEAHCRTITAHRFDIACGGARVAWMRVAAAIRQVGTVRAWIKDGRLNVVLPARGGSEKSSCMERPTYALGATAKDMAAGRNCRAVYRDNFDMVVMPAGFAPLSELGARFEKLPGAERAALSQPRAAGYEAELAAAAGPDPVIDPITGQPDTYDAGQRPHEWITVVRSESAGLGIGDKGMEPSPMLTWFLTALMFLSAAAIVRLRRAYDRSRQECLAAPRWSGVFTQRAMRAWWDRRGAEPSRRFTSAGGAVTSLIDATERVVVGLKNAGPLREVLQSELALVRQRVSSVDAVAGEAEMSAARTAAQFRGLVRELERIRRIADSAAASLADARSTVALPRTASEAYAVLGVNADASDGVLKKIVDALRMNWHPDHARGEDDRRLREERMRQINVAWELLRASRGR